MAFNIDEAKKAGYTDAEIADYLGKESNYNVSEARNSGYQDAEIVEHLVKNPAKQNSVIGAIKSGLTFAKDAAYDAIDTRTLAEKGLLKSKSVDENAMSREVEGVPFRADYIDKLGQQDRINPASVNAQAKTNGATARAAEAVIADRPKTVADIINGSSDIELENAPQAEVPFDERMAEKRRLEATAKANLFTDRLNAASATGSQENALKQAVEGQPSQEEVAQQANEIAYKEANYIEPNLKNILHGLAQVTPQAIETVKQGVKSQYADFIENKYMAQDARVNAQINRDNIEKSTPSFESKTAQGIYSGSTSLIQQIPALAASLATGNPLPSLASAGLLTEAEAYTRYRSRGAAPKDALAGALGEGAVEVLTEIAPMNFIVNKFGKVGAGQFIAGLLARDVLPEQAATLAQDAIDTAIANPNKTWGEYLTERPDAAYQTLVATITQAGAMSAGSSGANFIEKKLEKFKALPTENLERLKKTAELAMPADVPLIDAEIQRRANTPTLERATETAQRELDAQLLSDIQAGENNVSDNDTTTALADTASGITGNELAGSAGDGVLLPSDSASGRDNTDATTLAQSSADAGLIQQADQPDTTLSIKKINVDESGAPSLESVPVVGEQIDDEWTAFNPETGSLGIPRDAMPQIKAEHRGAMVNFLNARGIQQSNETLPASFIKPTQLEFSPAKVKKALGFKDNNRSILISSDNYVLDGHHQWMAKLQNGEEIDVIRLDSPIAELIETVKEFPSATVAGGAVEATKVTQEKPKVTLPAKSKLQPTTNPLVEKNRAKIESLIPRMAWGTIGNKRIDDAQGNQIGRTKWEPVDAEMDKLRVDSGISYNAMREASEKALAGQPLSKAEQRAIDLIADYAEKNEVSITSAITDEQAANIQAVRDSEPEGSFDDLVYGTVTPEAAVAVTELPDDALLEGVANLMSYDEVDALFDSVGEKNETGKQSDEAINGERVEAQARTDDTRGAGRSETENARPESQPATVKPQENAQVRQIVADIVKRRAAAAQINKEKAFDNYLAFAKRLMNGEAVKASTFKTAANTFKADATLAEAFNKLFEIAKAPAKEARAEKTNTIEAYKQRIADAKTVDALQTIAGEIQRDKSLTDAQAVTLDDAVFDAQDALEGTEPETEETPEAAPAKAEVKPVETMLQGVEAAGWTKLAPDDANNYVNSEGVKLRTYKKDGVRIALRPNHSLNTERNSAIVYSDPDSGNVIVEAILVDDGVRKQGKATETLKFLNELADKTNSTLYIEPVPLDNKPMNKEALVAFYAKNGFVAQSDANKVMVQKPNQKTTDLLGDNTAAKQAVADAERAKDAKRNTGNGETEGFTLTGSNSEADKAAAAGAQDLFAAPSKDEVTRAKEALDTAGVTGTEKLNTIAQVRDGKITADEVVEAHGIELKPKSKVDDYGEKLEGARKDLVRAMAKDYSDDEIASLPLSKLWPITDVNLIENKTAAAIAWTAREMIPSKPRKAYAVKRWVKDVKMLREIGRMVSNLMGKDDSPALKKFREADSLAHFHDKVALLEAIDRESWKRIGRVEAYPEAYGYKDGVKQNRPLVRVTVDGKTNTFNAATVADVVDKVNELLGVAPQDKRMAFEVRGRAGKYFINKKGDKNYTKLKEFTDAKADSAFAFIKDNYDELLQLWEDTKDRLNVKESDVRGKVNKPRTGKDYRKGRDVSTEEFATTFGFRGVQFGEWVKQGGKDNDRQGALNAAYDALMDLADIVGVPPKAMSLEGSLGLAFGARGSGKAAAHFESNTLVINLTKTNGAGTLAHEWFHALDNYFSRKRGVTTFEEARFNNLDYRKANYITYKPEKLYVHKNAVDGASYTKDSLEKFYERRKVDYWNPENWVPDPKHPQGVRPEVEERFAALVNALNASPMKERARAVDGVKEGTDGYWSRIIELAARSFENYVINKMQLNGYDNDYLANVVKVQSFGRDKSRFPYLFDEELAPVAEAFDNLFDTIETKEDGDNVVMFSMSKDAGTTYPLADRDTQWYGEANYKENGGRLVAVTPDEYLKTVRPLEIDELSRENIDDLKAHIESGGVLDPLTIYENGKEDGRHRANAAKELGIKYVPVVAFGDYFKDAPEYEAQNKTAFSQKPIFYSALTRAIDEIKINKAPIPQWKAILKNLAQKGVKPDEIEWTGVNEFLDLQTGTVTKEQVLDYLNSNGVQVSETLHTDGRDNLTPKIQTALEAAAIDYEYDAGDEAFAFYDKDGEVMVFDDLPHDIQTMLVDYEIHDKPTKYSQYTVAGGENYKELLLTLPAKNQVSEDEKVEFEKLGQRFNNEPDFPAKDLARYNEIRRKLANADSAKLYKAPHFDGRPNILAHVRFDERTDADGNKVLFINEIQSDWAQEGKKKGFHEGHNPTGEVKYDPEGNKDYPYQVLVDGNERNRTTTEDAAKLELENEIEASKRFYARGAIPKAPFVQKTDAWVSLALKRMMRYAAENGFDKVAIINGQQAADLYDISKQISEASARANGDGTYSLTLEGKDGQEIDGYSRSGKSLTPDELENTIGKEVAKKLIEGADRNKGKPWPKNVTNNPEFFTLRGLDLKVGGEGMRTFYDQIVPKVAKDVLKKLGGELNTATVKTREPYDGGTITIASDGTNYWASRSKTGERLSGNFDSYLKADGARVDIYNAEEKGATKQLGFNITESMREKVMQGLPLFSRSNTAALDTAKRRMDKFVTEYESGRMKDSDTQILGDTPTVLQALGAKNLPLQIDGATVSKVLNGKHKYDISAAALRDITDGIYDPLAVFESSVGGFIFLTELTSTNGKPVVAAVHINKKQGGMTVNDIASVYEKSAANKALEKWLNDGLLKYVRNENGLSNLATRHPELASIAKKMKDQSATVLSENDVVNTYGDRFASGNLKKGMPIPDVEAFVADFSKGWKRKPQVIVVDSMQDEKVAPSVRNTRQKMIENGSTGLPIGFISQGKVYVLAPMVNDKADIAEVLMHEIFGHAGLRGNFGDALDGILKQLWVGRRKDVVKKAKGYGLPVTMTDAVAAIKKSNPNLSDAEIGNRADAMVQRNRLTAAEEVLAEMTQTNPQLGFVKRAIAVIRAWLRANIQYFKNLDITDDDIIANIIIPARNFIKSGNGGGRDLGVAFEPNQIKSAIGNNGNFDGNNDDIRFSIQDNLNDDIPAETKAQTIQRIGQDKFNRFKVLQKWLVENGVELSEGADVYQAETLMSGRISTRKEDFRENQVKQLIKDTQDADLSMEQIGDFLKVQHAPEANKRARDLQGKTDATAYGISDAEAKAAMDEFRALPNFTELRNIANKWRNITEQTKQIKIDSGLLTPEMVAAWESTYEMYVPVKGNDEAGTQNGTGKGLDVKVRNKQRLGHGLRDEAIIENILRDHEAAISLDEKNRVGKALIKFALEAKNDDIITIGKPEKRKVLKQGESAYMVNYHGSDIATFENLNEARAYVRDAVLKGGDKKGFDIQKTSDPVRVMLQASPQLAENEVTVYVGGHAVRIQINDEVAAREYKNMGVEHLNTILSAGREVNNWLSKVYTGYSPDFIFTNPIRDAIQGAITLTGNLGGVTAAKIYTNYPSAVKELVKHFRNKGSSALVTDYRNSGGSTGGAYLSDLERIGDDIQAAYNEYQGALATYKSTYDKAIADGKSKKAAHALASMKAGAAGFKKIPIIGHFLKLMENVNAITENALRVATYKTLIDNGQSKGKAAAQAKNLMNFNRKGEQANAAGALYLFFNPAVQGTKLIQEALFTSPHKRQAQALAGSMTLMAFTLAMMALSGDEEDKDKWNKTPDHIKDGNIVFDMFGTQFTITLPYGYRVFWTLGNIMADATQKGANLAKLGNRMASSLFANFSPIGNPIKEENGKANFNPFQLYPTTLKMVGAPTKGEQGEDAFGSPITPRKWNPATPDSQLMNRGTHGSLYDGVSEKLNELSGGGKYEAGMVDVSPETFKFIVKSLLGGTGQFAFDSVNIVSQGAQGVAPQNVKDIPIARRFVRETGVSDARQAFWDRKNEADMAADQFALAKKAHDREGLMELRDKNGALIIMSKVSDKMLKMANAKRDAIGEIKLDDSISLKEKITLIKALEAEEEEVYNRYINMFDDRIKQ